MSHSRLNSRRSNYLDAVHSCRISLATSNQFTYFIQQGHSVYRIHVQQKKLVSLSYSGHIKTYGTVKKVITVALKVIHPLRIHFQHRGGCKQKNHPSLILEFRKRDIHYPPSSVSTHFLLKKKEEEEETYDSQAQSTQTD